MVKRDKIYLGSQSDEERLVVRQYAQQRLLLTLSSNIADAHPSRKPAQHCMQLPASKMLQVRQTYRTVCAGHRQGLVHELCFVGCEGAVDASAPHHGALIGACSHLCMLCQTAKIIGKGDFAGHYGRPLDNWQGAQRRLHGQEHY